MKIPAKVLEPGTPEFEAANKLVDTILGIGPKTNRRLNEALNVFGSLLQITCDMHNAFANEFMEKHGLDYQNGVLTDEDVLKLPGARKNTQNLVSVLLSAEALLAELRKLGAQP